MDTLSHLSRTHAMPISQILRTYSQLMLIQLFFYFESRMGSPLAVSAVNGDITTFSYSDEDVASSLLRIDAACSARSSEVCIRISV